MMKKRYAKLLVFLMVVLVSFTACSSRPNHNRLSQHDYHFVKTLKEAGCVNTGEALYECECGATKKERTEVLGHDYVEKIISEPTCEKNGEKEVTCSRCGLVKQETIFSSGHNWNETVIEEATCKAAGKSEAVCSRCGIKEIRTISPSHNYKKTVVKEATCNQEGQVRFVCSNCGDEYWSTINKTSHKYDSDGKCVYCGTRKKGEIKGGSETGLTYFDQKFNVTLTNSCMNIAGGLNLFFDVKKTYDKEGNTNVDQLGFNVIVKDSKGNVVASDTGWVSRIVVDQTVEVKMSLDFKMNYSENYSVIVSSRR